MQAKLTDTIARKAEPGLYWDSHPGAPAGFLLRVTPAGARAWCLNYRVKDTGRERRLTIGDIAAWPIATARERAAELRRIVDAGGDPLGQLSEKRAAPTVAALAERFIAESLPRRSPGTQGEYRSILDRYILPAIGDRKVAAVERADLEKLHRQITADGKLRRANAALTIAHVLFEQAIAWQMRAEHDNPASRVKRNQEHGRERYLDGEELERLMTVLDRWQARAPDSVDQIRLLLLTGARRGEVISMAWEQLDLDAGVWSKPATMTKQRRPHRVPLSAEAVAILRRRLAEREQDRIIPLNDDRVFRGSGVVAYRLERHWFLIRVAAGLEDVRLHDLRHSFASALVGQGWSLPIIGALLGHSKPATTSRYAHLADQPLRDAVAVVGRLVGGGGAK